VVAAGSARLSGNPNKASFVEAMTALHSHLFDLPAERMREDELGQCYRSVQRELERTA
jgi:hypothetical protein